MREEIVKRELICQLTVDEWMQRATNLARANKQKEKLQAEASTIAKDFKDRIGGVSGQAKKLMSAVLTRAETRTIDCVWRQDFSAKQKFLVRSDTGDVIETQTMSAADLQTEMPISHESDDSSH